MYSQGSELEGFVAVQRDISERRQLEQEMLKSQRLESLGILAGGLAHDFNNFLTSVMLNVSTARQQLRDNPEVDGVLTSAEQALTRAEGVTHQLLTFSRGGEPVKISLYLSPIVKEAAKFSLHGTIITPVFDLPDDLPPVKGDPAQLAQAINNLCLNAAQSMNKGGKLYIRGTVRDLTVEESDIPVESGMYIMLTIEDEGTGIPAEHLHSIFDPYFTTKETGSGLGLASCFSIIQKHGGWITASNRVQGGACFTIYFPASEEAPTVVDYIADIPGGTGRILIKDDDEAIRMGMAETLQQFGYEVVACNEGDSALKAFHEADDRGKPFDLVILDLTIKGGMGGLETIRKLQKIDPDIKGIVCSGYSNDPVLAKPQEYGFNGVLSKPFGPKALKTAIDALLPPDMDD